MATNVVNLDAMIPREDLMVETGGERPGSGGQERVDIHHLDDHFFATRLRKPDFQRETAHWSPEKAVDLIRSFAEGDLIPAVILWQSGSYSFVIDGAHRLSALIAWVLDDYGDQKKSLEFFGGRIPDEQRRVADRTRKLVKTEVGAYGEFAAARRNPSALSESMLARFNNLAHQYITAQWVPKVDREAAEQSFFKINEAATPIDPTERKLLKARKSASALSARAVTRAGTGHQYWSPFDEATRQRIRDLGKYINEALYNPALAEGPVRTLDVPVAGKSYNTLPFVFDLVNLVNEVTLPKSNKRRRDQAPPAPIDEDGTLTTRYLERVKREVDRITGNSAASFGVHPVVYFYSKAGLFQPAAFFATLQLVRNITERSKVENFLRHRKRFEEYLVAHKEHMSRTVHKFGAGERSIPQLYLYMETAFQHVSEGSTDEEVLVALADDPNFAYLIPPKPPLIELEAGEDNGKRKQFSRKTKSAAFIESAIKGSPRCGLCGGFVHTNSMHIDHKMRVREGGKHDSTNAQLAHPICDSRKS